MSTHHAKAARLSRLAEWFRTPPAPGTDPRMPVPPGMPGIDTRTWVPERREVRRQPHGIDTPARLNAIVAQAEAEARAASIPPPPRGPWDRPDADTLRKVARKLRALPADAPAPEPAPAVPDLLRADICRLPLFRDTIRGAARRQHAGCDCEPADEFAAWREWMAGQYAHVIPGTPALSWWTLRTVQLEAATAEMRQAA